MTGLEGHGSGRVHSQGEGTRPGLAAGPISRRVVLAGAGSIGVTLMCGLEAAMAEDFTKPFTGFAPPSTRLRDGSLTSNGLAASPLAEARAAIRSHLLPQGTIKPMYAGAVGLWVNEGIVETEVCGQALRYADETTELPAAQQISMRRDTIFDLASVSKLFTSLLVVQLIEEGAVELAAPVARYLPEFAAAGKESVTIQQLLTHTSGFPAWLPLWSAYPDPPSRIHAVMDAVLINAPGSTYLYSDLNLITLGVLVARLRGKPLPEVLHERVTGPLRMSDTGYNPTDRARCAATEYQVNPPRGMVQGEVHDENAWSLDGVAGHAGVFSTADDLAILCQCLLNGGIYNKARILNSDTVKLLITNYNTDFPGDSHGLGFELDQRWYMDALSGARTAGHTGYTGTSMVIDFASRSIAILLTNRVHPSRNWGTNNPARREWARGLGLAMGVKPTHGDSAWFAANTNSTTSTLATPALSLAAPAVLSFDLFVDTEETDLVTLECSTDGGASWAKVPMEIRDRGEIVRSDGSVSGAGSRHWMQARADVAAGAATLRWRYVTDALYLGRGVAIDDVQVVADGTKVFDGERNTSAFVADGWTLQGRAVVS